ncbi:hypothetical protein BDQ12DRAFT_461756 [Crucibulum laeve]|uniref:MATH domain-containing protein n=1 Tax=Crucibulum laeve TaxID=68775 RepID=A0A5C3MA08_9AGAR|nr:hypothetical protein BDQ12DRAFT_461756 [Crucibulum laeve]
MEVDPECQESHTITFEWTLRDLKNLFDTSKGDAKSKVTKSAKFGGGKWQILFYSNAGTTKEGSTDGGFVSLYLSCEPSAEEKESALAESGRWVRDGVYKFSFELRNIGKSVLYNLKEAHNHSFSYKTANWGWAQFARRDNVYYQSPAVKAQDAFVIICTITSSPAAPPPPPEVPRQLVPKPLLDTVGALLDNALYSDVQFIIPRRGQSLKIARKIWASRLLLRRAEYFDAMFSSNFVEGASEGVSMTPRTTNQPLATPANADCGSIMDEFEDSDDEEEDEDFPMHSDNEDDATYGPGSTDGPEDSATPTVETNVENMELSQSSSSVSSPSRGSFVEIPSENQDNSLSEPLTKSKMTVVVRDVAYSTYRAILYYIYTDNIVFAPLSSTFLSARVHPFATPSSSLPSTPSENQGQILSAKRISPQANSTTRPEWIREWLKNNPGRPAPCSAKAAYRVADHLIELKERAAKHIFKSLTVDNIAYEVFSPFSAAFDEIRKVEVNFFLEHWQDIRSSESMRNVWQQIRNGRHPGFEEVWPLIAQSLEFKPSAPVNIIPPKGGEPTAQQG